MFFNRRLRQKPNGELEIVFMPNLRWDEPDEDRFFFYDVCLDEERMSYRFAPT